MSDREKYSLMIWCGALRDIAEKTNEHFTKKQVEDVRKQIERLTNFQEDFSNYKNI